MPTILSTYIITTDTVYQLQIFGACISKSGMLCSACGHGSERERSLAKYAGKYT